MSIRSGIAALLLTLGSVSVASATLLPVLVETGRISFSIDGVGTNSAQGAFVEVEKPSDATLRSAFLSCAAVAVGFGGEVIPQGGVTIDGTGAIWQSNISNGIFPSNTFADVTHIVKPVVDSAPAGRVALRIVELDPFSIDGCALGVVMDDPGQRRDRTVVVLFGGQDTRGDLFPITLAQPLNLIDPASRADMGLAISFSAQDQTGVGGSRLCGTESGMYSAIDVNGIRLTTCAGNADDGVGPIANGMLFTVGGLDDSNANPVDPTQQPADGSLSRIVEDELYDLKPFVETGDTSIIVDTVNPSADDNIFLAYFATSLPSVLGEGVVLAPLVATKAVGAVHTVTATVVDDLGQPVVARTVSFEVTSGPNQGRVGTDATDGEGRATFSYPGSGGPGVDTIVARFVDSTSETVESNQATQRWIIKFAYYALGDSIASGHGLADGDGRNTDDETGCRRSPSSYPFLVARELRRLPAHLLLRFSHLACSGARTYEGGGRPKLHLDLPEQVDCLLGLAACPDDKLRGDGEFPEDQRTLISITIGANDYEFPRESLTGWNLCDSDFGQWSLETASRATTNLERQLRRILTAVPNAIVILTDYHNPFNRQSHFFKKMREVKARPPTWHANPQCRNHCSNNVARSCEEDDDCSGLLPIGTAECMPALTDDQLFARVERVLATLNAGILIAGRSALPEEGQLVGLVSVTAGFRGVESARPNCGDARPAYPSSLIQYPAFHVGDANFFIGRPDLQDLLVGNDCFHIDEMGAAAFALGAPGGDGGLVGAFSEALSAP